jgi:FAD/FMN-containing dehydrogenase
VRPETYSDILNLHGRTLIARGAGLSYCAASLSDEAVVVDMSQMNRILQFKPDEYFVEVEAGMAIGDLNNFLLERWLLSFDTSRLSSYICGWLRGF